MSILDPRLWLAALAIAAAMFFVGKYDERRVWVAREAAASATAQTKLDEATKRADIADSTMKTKVKEAEDEKDKQVAVVNRKLDTALNELRSRPARRANAGAQGAGTVGQCAGASGAELSKPDAGFLTREAARADSYIIELNACNVRYDDVAREINKLAPQ